LKMTDNAVQKVINMLNRALENPIEGLSADTKVLEIAGFDSLTMERLAGELQNELGIEVNPLAFAQVETISDLAILIDKPRSGN
jgi:acyl carrier protein